MLDMTRKCRICGRPYKVYSLMAGDQSACPACVREAERATREPDTREQEVRRKTHWVNK